MLRVNQLIGFGVGGGAPVPTQPLWNPADKDSDVTLATDDRQFTVAGGTVGSVRSTVAVDDPVGRYVEFSDINNSGSTIWRIGVATAAHDITTEPGAGTNSWALAGNNNTNGARYYFNGSDIGNWGFGQPAPVTMIAYKAGSLWFGEDGSWDGDPAAGTGATLTGIVGPVYLIGGKASGSGARGATFADFTAHTYSPPTGFLAGW